MPTPTQQVGATVGSTASTSLAVTLSGAINAGDSIIVLVQNNGTGLNVSSITGGSGAAWTKRNTTDNSTACGTEIWDSLAQTSQPGGATVTLNFPSQAFFSAIVLVVPNLASFDNSPVGTTGNSTTPTTANITPAQANEFLVACRTDGHTWLPSAGPTNGFTATTPTPNNETGAYLDDTGTAAINTGWTIGAASSWATSIAAYKVNTTTVTGTASVALGAVSTTTSSKRTTFGRIWI